MKKILSVFLLTLTFTYAADKETHKGGNGEDPHPHTHQIGSSELADQGNTSRFKLYLECVYYRGLCYSLKIFLFFLDYVVTPPLKLIGYLID